MKRKQYGYYDSHFIFIMLINKNKLKLESNYVAYGQLKKDLEILCNTFLFPLFFEQHVN